EPQILSPNIRIMSLDLSLCEPAQHVVQHGLRQTVTAEPPERSRRHRRVNQKDLVLQRNDRLAAAGVTLPRTAAEQLPIDPTRFVVFGENHMQATALRYALWQTNVGAPSSHVGGDCHTSRLRSPRHHIGLVAILLGIEQRMLDANLPQNAAD